MSDQSASFVDEFCRWAAAPAVYFIKLRTPDDERKSLKFFNILNLQCQRLTKVLADNTLASAS